MNFECKKCGKCCSNILPLSVEEIKNIKKIPNKKENKLLVDANWEMRCPFLNSSNKCDIYEERPLICREYDCSKFEQGLYSSEMMEEIKKNKYRVVDMRREFFKK